MIVTLPLPPGRVHTGVQRQGKGGEGGGGEGEEQEEEHRPEGGHQAQRLRPHLPRQVPEGGHVHQQQGGSHLCAAGNSVQLVIRAEMGCKRLLQSAF